MKLTALLFALLLSGGQRSGLEDMSPALQVMQRDDAQNPGLLWVEQGKALVSTQCLFCHGLDKLRDAATRFPAFDSGAGRVLDLAQRVNRCRKTQPLTHESEEMLAVTAYLGFLARGQPIQPAASAELSSAARQGERLFHQPMGQLGLSCAQCHDQSAGRRLAGSLIPQGHPTGYPIYRLEWQGMGSLQRRLRGCLTGVRAEPFAADSPDWVALEAYLMQRAAGMPLETPAVRP
jgi:sulfur-oxidizing protein SoxA